MRVTLDTNIVISGLISLDGPPARVLDMWVEGRISVSVSPALVEETLNVITRAKFKSLGTVDERHHIIKGLFERANIVLPADTITVIGSDDADNRVLECAVSAEVDVIVSGDSHLLDLDTYEGIPIITPAEFLRLVD